MKTAPCKICRSIYHTKSHHTIKERKPRPCKWCGVAGTHLEFTCSKKVSSRVKVNTKMVKLTAGKHTKLWLKTRTEWFKIHPDIYYSCHYCLKQMGKSETTLDHKESRSRRPDLRYELTNLVPCCYTCNATKGSKSHDEYCLRCVT